MSRVLSNPAVALGLGLLAISTFTALFASFPRQVLVALFGLVRDILRVVIIFLLDVIIVVVGVFVWMAKIFFYLAYMVRSGMDDTIRMISHALETAWGAVVREIWVKKAL